MLTDCLNEECLEPAHTFCLHVHATLSPSFSLSSPVRERESEREREGVKEGNRGREGERGIERERDVEYGY